MTGTVWKDEDTGTWRWRAVLGRKADGSPLRRQRNNYPTKRAAAEAMAEAVAASKKGAVVETNTMTVGTYLDKWLAAVQPGLRPATYAQYDTILHAWVTPHLGGKRLADLRPMDVQGLYTFLSSKGGKLGNGLAPSSVNTTHRILRQALDQAIAWQLLAVNPATPKLSRPRSSAPKAAHWSPEQAKAFLTATRKHRLYPAFVLMLTSGMRRGEVVGLRWGNVDLEGRRVTVVHTRIVVNGRAQDSIPKTAAGIRVIELSDAAVRVLGKHKAEHGTDAGYVFVTDAGKPIHPDVFRHSIDTAAKACGLPPLTPKGFRHTAATIALASGVHPKKVQEMLGHSNIQITLDTYSHVIQGQHRDAANALDTALFDEDE